MTINIKYCKTDAGWTVGYIEFGSRVIFSATRDEPEKLKQGMFSNLYSYGYRKRVHGEPIFELTEISISDMPLDVLQRKYYNKWFEGAPEKPHRKKQSADDSLPTAQFKAGVFESLPTTNNMAPMTPPDGPVQYKVIGDELIVFREIARYKLG